MNEKNWFSKHADTLVLIGLLIGGLWQINQRFYEIDQRITQIDMRLTRIETVMIMQKIMPQELCANKNKEKE